MNETNRLRVSIYYEDTDAGGKTITLSRRVSLATHLTPPLVPLTGLVHHSNYLKYFERGREHVLGPKMLVDLYAESGRSFVVTNVDVNYRRGARHGDTLEIRTIPRIESDYRLAFTQNVYRIRKGVSDDTEDGRDDELLVKGFVEMVCVDKTMKLTKLPASLLAEMTTATTTTNAVKRFTRSAHPHKTSKGMLRNAPFEMCCYLDETDFTGVAYYANYLKFMERARASILSAKVLAAIRREEGLGAAIYEAKLRFKQGARFGDTLVITTETHVESEYRLVFHHKVFRRTAADDDDDNDNHVDTLLVTGEVSIVCLDNGGCGKLVKMPSRFLDLLRLDAERTAT